MKNTSYKLTIFLDTEVFKGPRHLTLRILDSQTNLKPTGTFQCTHFSPCHPFNTKKGFIKGEALRLLRTNSVKENFLNTNETINKYSVAEGIPQRSFIKSAEVQLYSEWFEPRSINSSYCVIVRVRVVLKRTVVGD